MAFKLDIYDLHLQLDFLGAIIRMEAGKAVQHSDYGLEIVESQILKCCCTGCHLF